MYDRRLDAIVSAADLGSFSRAAERLCVSTPALVKQVSGFEAEHGVTLFERSHAGVRVTPAGARLVEDAREIMRRSEAALRRARDVDTGGKAVRLGVSLMCPGRNTLAMWPRIQQLEPGLRLEIVTVGDLYDPRTSVMGHLGEEVDVIQSSYSTFRWGGSCQLLPIFSTPFNVDVPRTHALAGRKSLTLDDLNGMCVRMLRHANDATDQLRDLLMFDRDVRIVDAESFDFALFNEAEECGDAVLTSGAWSEVHPGFVGIPLACDIQVPCFLAFPQTPSPQVSRFVDAMRRVLSEQGE